MEGTSIGLAETEQATKIGQSDTEYKRANIKFVGRATDEHIERVFREEACAVAT